MLKLIIKFVIAASPFLIVFVRAGGHLRHICHVAAVRVTLVPSLRQSLRLLGHLMSLRLHEVDRSVAVTLLLLIRREIDGGVCVLVVEDEGEDVVVVLHVVLQVAVVAEGKLKKVFSGFECDIIIRLLIFNVE